MCGPPGRGGVKLFVGTGGTVEADGRVGGLFFGGTSGVDDSNGFGFDVVEALRTRDGESEDADRRLLVFDNPHP